MADDNRPGWGFQLSPGDGLERSGRWQLALGWRPQTSRTSALPQLLFKDAKPARKIAKRPCAAGYGAGLGRKLEHGSAKAKAIVSVEAIPWLRRKISSHKGWGR